MQTEQHAHKDDAVTAEVNRRIKAGGRRVTLQEFDEELRAIGYRLDRSMDAEGLNRYMEGELAGVSYPAVNMYVVQVSDGMSAFHVDARRDANFERLQHMRFHQTIFAVNRGRIYGI